MVKMRLFANVLVVGTLVVFGGCKKTEDNSQEDPAVDAQPAIHTEPEDGQQQTTVLSGESTAPAEHEVVVIVRDFLNAVDGGDYDRAIGLGTPDEFKREGLIQVNEAFDFAGIGIAEAFVGEKNAAVLIDSVSGPSGTGQFGYSLVTSDNRWLVRDVDWLPTNEAVEKWLDGFKRVEPNAKSVAGTD